MSSGHTRWAYHFADPRSEDDAALAGNASLSLARGRPGDIVVIPLITERGVTVGSGLMRKPGLVEAIRAIPGIGAVRLSPIGGTIGPGGPEWLALLMVVRLPEALARPLDALLGAALHLLQRPLAPYGLELAPGRVAGAWCPGFSDLAVQGRKLVGIGFKLTREVALMRAVVGLREPSPADLHSLDAGHRAFGPGVQSDSLTWLGQLIHRPRLTQTEAIHLLASANPLLPEKISA
ncbi:MAG: hypothetical protein ACYCYK_09025 [Candidatus Dormibacteria bacterium]